MNNKRQTVWLVSMLSLMVVLSAYYLFTEDAGKLNLAGDVSGVQDVKVDTQQMTTDAGKSSAKTDTPDQAAANAAGKDAQAGAAAAKTDSGKAGAKGTDTQKQPAKAAEAGVAGKDAEDQILKRLESQSVSGSDYIASQQLKRSEELSKKASQLQAIITDPKQSVEALSKANEDFYKLEQQEAKITDIEEELQKEYKSAMVTEDGNKWKVIVHNDQLEKSQAVSIVELVMNKLNVGPELVSVQVLRS